VSVSQAQVCFLNELDPASVAYQFQAVIWLHGTLDVAALSQALGEIVARHEIYRTTFPRAGGSWVQHVHEPFSVELPVHDLTAEPDADAALEQLAAERFTQRIAIDRLPLVRWTLARVGPERHALLHGEHHLVHDGWSMMVLLRELRELYDAAVEGRPTPLAAPAIQFADFAVWQHELLDTALAREQLAYWTRRLADAPDPLELPYDAPRPARQTFRGDQVCLTLPPELAARLRELAQEQRATLFTTMLAAFLVLLHRYSGASDVVVGSGLANRRLREVEDLIGMLVNTVALRVDLSGDPTVTELLARVRSTVLEAHVHQDVPFERVVEAVAPARSASQGPLYQTLFSFADAPLPDLRAPGLQIVPDETAGNGSAKAEINVVVVNHSRRETAQDGELTLVWEYNSDLFSAATAQRAVAHYRTLLEAFVADPDRTVSALELADDAERGRLAAHAAGPAPAYERTATIAEIFEQRVAERPDAVAIVAHREQLTYGELNARANRLAHRLRTLGVTRETPVGICLERSPAMIVTLLGILKSGGAYVALDPSFPAPRVHLLAHDAGTAIICTESRFRDLVPDDAELLCFDELDLAGESDEDLPHDGAATDLAYIAYTSGSTGEPKGVEITHRAVARLVRGADYVELSFGEVLLALAPLAFDASTFEIWGALLNGGRLAIAPPGSLSPFEIAQAVRAHDVTTLWLTAGLFHKFVELEPETLGGVRQLVAGGDVLSPAAVARALEVLPADGVLVNGYGPTEGTTFTCCHRMRAGSEVSGPIPIGRPIANTRVHILDGHGQPVPVGVRGELHIGGDGVARGYRQRPELTAERFVPDPFGPQGGRLYRTGDLARWRADGVVEFLGRIDDQVKIRGFRVEPGEVESALASHPAVRDAAVVAQRRAGEDRRLVAYVVLRDGADANGRELRRFLAEQLPAHLVPSAWVTLDELALTPNGKIDRSGLLEPIADERAGRRGDRLEEPLERAVADIFERVLGVRPTPADDDFFDLGGHSLLAVELFAAIERDMGVRLPLATIFEAPTVHELAAVLGPQERVVPWSSLVGLTTTGSRIPFFAVTAGDGNAVGFGQLARHLGPEQPFYALQPRGLDGRTRLHTSVEAMARHCLTEVRGVQPEGPYLLGGRCLGGLIAFEMARRLEAIGEEVALLVVLDSLGPRWAPRPLADGIGYDEVVNLCWLRAAADGLDFGDLATAAGAREFIGWLREPAVVGDVPVPRYLHEAYLARPDVQAAYPDLHGDDAGRLMNWAWASGRHELGLQSALFGPPTAAAQRLRPERPSRARRIATRAGARAGDLADVAARGRSSRLTARREQRLNTIASAAAERYRAREYGGRITLIRSEEFLGDVEIARWRGVASGGLDEQLILGSHRSMLREPDVASLAARLADLFAQRTASRLPG
jgi:amino acid adenylation domain-containing protein